MEWCKFSSVLHKGKTKSVSQWSVSYTHLPSNYQFKNSSAMIFWLFIHHLKWTHVHDTFTTKFLVSWALKLRLQLPSANPEVPLHALNIRIVWRVEFLHPFHDVWGVLAIKDNLLKFLVTEPTILQRKVLRSHALNNNRTYCCHSRFFCNTRWLQMFQTCATPSATTQANETKPFREIT
jgi:hypothetical protein